MMKTEIGLWIDHKEAVIVTLVDQIEEIKHVPSNIEKDVRYVNISHSSHDDTTEIRRDRKDRRFDDYLSTYYDEVIKCLQDADSILIFGPGKAKKEFQKQLESQSLGNCIEGVETTDKMTEGQIVAKVRKYFLD